MFNILAIGGVVSAIRPVAIPASGHTDIWLMALLPVVLLRVAIRGGRTITRREGAFLLAVFLLFLA